jgi:hypothetical protein
MAPLPHLARRFLGTMRHRHLSPAEQTEVAHWLSGPALALFWAQAPSDRRHGLDCARLVTAASPGRPDLVRAALLHDIGKRRAGLGIIGRALASGLQMLHLPVRGRLASYLAHGPSGAEEVEGLGLEPVVAAYTRHHHQGRPPVIPADDWAVLSAADKGQSRGQ